MDLEAVIVMLGFGAMPFIVAAALVQQTKQHRRTLSRLPQYLDEGEAKKMWEQLGEKFGVEPVLEKV